MALQRDIDQYRDVCISQGLIGQHPQLAADWIRARRDRLGENGLTCKQEKY